MLDADQQIVLAIPTFRRPRLLLALLDSLFGDEGGYPAIVIIGDNDCSEEVRSLVNAYPAPSGVRLIYLAVPERGVSQVRNALLTEIMHEAPEWRWLVMLDDDGLVTPGWLPNLIACGERFDAHLVGGPVEGVLPKDASFLARHSIFAERRRWETGPVETLNTTQNLAISRRLLDLIDTPLFRSELGASGGEDYDLFRRTHEAGGRLVWCDEAIIREPAPAERLTARALIWRYYSTGVYMSPIDRAYDGAVRGALLASRGLAKALADLIIGTATRNEKRVAGGVLYGAHHLGRGAGLVGAKSGRYVQAQKAKPDAG
jgi:glycosyltransferase involved in cell wall biosynthesis